MIAAFLHVGQETVTQTNDRFPFVQQAFHMDHIVRTVYTEADNG